MGHPDTATQFQKDWNLEEAIGLLKFEMDENPNYVQSVTEKLMLVGWVKKNIRKDQPSGNELVGIEWTETGKVMLTTINTLIATIEAKVGKLSKEELFTLRELSRLMPTAPLNIPPPPKPGRF